MDTKNTQILIVDDEPINIRILTGMLSQEGYRILLHASSGQEALEVLKKCTPDIILLDVMMPEMDGFELCKKIKERKDKGLIPVVMVTALQDKIHRQMALEAGADDFLTKPIDRTELIIRIKSLVRIKQYSDELLESNKLLKEKKEELKRLERAKEALTHMIVHDLRSPLTNISMNLEVSLMKIGKDEEIRRYLENASYQCTYLDSMIQGLLDIYKMEKGNLTLKKQKIRPEPIIKDVAERFIPQLESKKIYLDLKFPENCRPIPMDKELICRVIGNLLDNAIRHTPFEGNIEIGLEEKDREKKLIFYVMDSGKGLDEKYHERIFDRFEQIELRKEGITNGSAGLGLNFCKMVVELHGGKIWVSNRSDNSGCIFSFYLPYEG